MDNYWVGGTNVYKRCPVIFRWMGTGSASTDSDFSGAGFGLKWVKYFTELPASAKVTNPAVEGIQYDGINTLMVAVRDSKNDEVRNYRIALDTGLGDATGPGSVTNALPTVTITSPANNATFTAGTNITITANAEDSDGAIAKVEFFRNDTKLGQSTTSPYSIAWNNASVGSYSLKARATDNAGAVRTSIEVNVQVNSQNTPAPDTTAPTISSVVPAESASNVSISSSIVANFSEPINASTITGTTFAVTKGVAAIAGNLVVSGDGKTVTFTPSASLPYESVITVTVTTGVKDPAGNGMAL